MNILSLTYYFSLMLRFLVLRALAICNRTKLLKISMIVFFTISLTGFENVLQGQTTITKSIATGTDDVEEGGVGSTFGTGHGYMYNTSPRIELTRDDQDPSSGNQTVGLRFTGMTIPKNAIITSAYLTFRGVTPVSPNSNSGTTNVTIKGQAADNPGTFTTTAFDVSNRPGTSATVAWAPATWSDAVNYNSPSIISIVQELVNRSGWNSGNAMVFVISGTGSRSAHAYEGSTTYAPKLTVTYSTAAPLSLSTSVTNVLCRGNASGAIDLSVSGGITNYTYDWSNDGPEAPDNDTQDLSSLAAGSYVVTVTDAVGTTATATATITQPGSSVSLSSVVTKVSSSGGNNGAIDLSVSGGTAGYTYLWSNGATTQDISSLTAGNYTVTVTDGNGCPTNLSVTVETNTNNNIVNKQLYLSESLGLDRINPAAPPLDNTTSVTPTLSTGASGVVLENTSTITSTSGSTVTLSHTIGNGENRCLLVAVSSRDRSVNSITYGGVSLVSVGNRTYGSDARVYLYSLINPNIGTADIVVTMSGSVSNGVVLSASSFFGIDQTVPLGTFASATGSSSTASVNVSSIAGDYIYDVVTFRNTSNLTVGAGQTERWDLSSGTIRGAGSSESATATSSTMSWTGSSARWVTGGVALKPASFINTLTFTENPVLCSALTIKANNAITFSAYINVISGTMPVNPNITTVIKNGGTNIVTLTNPTYNSATGLLTWSGTRGSDVTIPAGQAISLDITTNQAGVSFQIRHDSQLYPSKITMPVSTFINVNSVDVYNASYPNGQILTGVPNVGNSYIRVAVTDPFGASDITGVNLAVTRPDMSTINISLDESYVVGAISCGKIYQYTWPNPGNPGTWTIQATANEGSEGVTHTLSITKNVVIPTGPIVQTKYLYLSDPSQALDRIDPVSTSDGTTSQSASLSATGTTTATFTQNPTMCGALSLASGGAISVKTFASIITGSRATVTAAATSSGSAASVSNGSSLTFSHTPGTGPNRLLLVAVSVGNTGVSDEAAPGTVTGVTFGGTPMTLVSAVHSGVAVRSYIYRLLNPTASPSANVVVTIGTKTSGVIASATTFNNVNQSTPLGTAQTFLANGGDYFVAGNVTSAVGELIFSTSAVDEYVNVQQGISANAGQTELWNNSGFNFVSGASSTIDGASSVYIRYNMLDYEDGCIAAVSIKPAASSTLVSNPNITAVLKYGSTTIATLTNPSFNSSTNLLTWTSTLPSNVNIPAGQAISLAVTTAEPMAVFRLDYDSQTKPSKIELPVSNYIDITSLDFYNAPFPGGSIISSANNGATVYLRATVSNPFGTGDITGMDLNISPLGINVAATSVATSSCTRTYQYIWNTPSSPGEYNITATAKEGYENQVVDFDFVDFSLCPLTISPAVIATPTCNIPDGGDVDLNVTGGNGPYTWSWSRTSPTGSGNGSGLHMTGLEAGVYSITVTSVGGCTGSANVTVTGSGAPIVEAVVTNTGTSCYDGGINLSVSSGSGNYTYFWADGVYTQNRINLTQGLYSVTVTDQDNGCTATAEAEILSGAPIDAGVFILYPSCAGGNDGLINLSPVGGTGDYTYLWADAATTEDRSGLSAGNYTVTISDSGTCTSVFVYTLSNPEVLGLTLTKTDPTCILSGSIITNATGGTTPYQYNWEDISGPNNPKNRTDLLPGNYTLTVTDQNGCTTSAVGIIEEADCDLDAYLVCTSNVSDVYKVDPDPTILSYQWSVPMGAVIVQGQGTSQITINWSNATPGFDQVCVHSINDCGESSDVCTPVYIKTVVPSIAFSNPVCEGLNINFEGSGGVSYQWSGPNNFTSNLAFPVILNATAGNSGLYQVTVTSEDGCTASTSANVVVHTNPNISLAAFETSTCESDNGSINLTVTGGATPYTYLWSNGFFVQDLNNIPVGSYLVTVTDVNGCTNSGITSVNASSGLSLSNTKTDVTCYDGNNGTINLTVAGGSDNYEYQWSNGVTTQDVSSIKAGLYRVTVTDKENGCLGMATVDIQQPSKLQADKTVEHIDAFGASNGEIEISVIGGSPAYNYDWADLSGTNNPAQRTSLSAGLYVVTITDTQSCPEVVALNLNQPESPLTLNILQTNITCFGSADGIANLTVTGGNAPYTYLWSTGSTREDLTGLVPGVYTVTVTDAMAVSSTMSATIVQPLAINFNVSKTDVSCFGANSGAISLNPSGGTSPYTYRWSNGSITKDISNLNANSYVITITDANGCSTTSSIDINAGNQLNVVNDITHVSCAGSDVGSINISVSGGSGSYAYLWSNGATSQDLTNISAGNYIVTITDSALCSAVVSSSVVELSSIAAESFVSPLSCTGVTTGNVDLVVGGGTSPYIYVWNNGATTEDLSNIQPGIYTVTITDAGSCSIQHIVNVVEPASLTVNAIQTYTNCFGVDQGNINTTISGGTAPYKYAWSNGMSTPNLTNLADGVYILTVTDYSGCSSTSISLLAQPSKVVVTGGTIPNCPGQLNGSIMVFTTGGSRPYIFNWSDGGPNSTERTGLGAGSYGVTVIDNNGCSASTTFEVKPLTLDFFNVIPSCGRDPETGNTYVKENGQVYAKVSGGLEPYNYSWSTGGTLGYIENLPLGNYSVTVESNGCTITGETALSGNVCIPPVAADDFYLTEMNVGVNGNLAINDYDPNTEYPLTFLPLGYINEEVGIIKWDSTFNGEFQFTPATNYFGTFSLPYQICDTLNLCDIGNLTVRVEKPVLGLAKEISYGPINNEDGTYDFTYTIRVENKSLFPLTSVQITDHLDATFPNVISYSINNISSTQFSLNNAYNGSNNINLLVGNDVLAPLATGLITIDMTLTPGQERGPFNNSAIGSAISPLGVLFTDVSQNGSNPDPDNDGDPTNNNEPTPLLFCPAANFTGPTTICIASTTTMSPSSGGTWESADPTIATISNSGVVTGISVGSTTFTFHQNGCSSEPSIPVTVIGQVAQVIGSTSLCLGSTTTLSPSSGGTWSSTNPSVATVNNAGVVTGVANGTATFRFTETSTGCTSLPTQIVNVNNRPLITITGPTSICVGGSTSLSPTSGGVWTSSNPSVATINNAGVVTAIVQGIATFTFTLSSGCVSNPSNPITINGKPTATISGDQSICIGASTQLIPSTGGTWVSSHPLIASVTNSGLVTGITSGQATFIYTETSSGCVSNPSSAVQIKTKPIISLTGDDEICAGLTTSFSPSSGGIWTSSNTAIATISNAGLVFGVGPGQATFRFRDNNTGCNSDASTAVTIHPKPIINFNCPSIICVGDNSCLLPEASGTGGTWISSNNAIAQINQEGIVVGIAAGSVTFTYTAPTTGCISNPSTSMTVIGKPVVNIVGSSTICIGTTTTLSPSTGGTWTSSNSAVATINNSGVVTGVSPGTAIFYFTETSTGCISLASAPITVNLPPTVSLSGPSTICVGFTTNVLPSSGGVWTSNNPTIATVTNSGIVTGISNGVVQLTYTSGNGCISTTPTLINVNGKPSITLNGPSSICIGSSTSFLPSSGGVWVSNHPSIATITNSGIVTAIAPGTATFTFTDNITNCVSVTSTSIVVNAKPTVNISGSNSICVGAMTTVTPTVNGTWSSSNPAVATVNNIGAVLGISEGTATFTFTQTATGCASDPTASIQVKPKPTIEITGDASICIGTNTQLLPSSGGTWTSTQPSIASINSAGLVTSHQAGSARFIFTSSSTGCLSNQSTPVVVLPKPAVSILGSTEICIGATTTLLPNSGGTWTSNHPSIASVSNSGIVTGLAEGSATFTFVNSETGCTSNPTLPILVQSSSNLNLSNVSSLCVGFSATLTASTQGVWASNNPDVATITAGGVATGIAAGFVSFTFQDNSGLCNNVVTTDTIQVDYCILPDFNFTSINVLVNGNVHTNDMAPAGATYGTPILQSKPSESTPNIVMNTDGSYTFVTNQKGEYIFSVPICANGFFVNCATSLLTINVTDILEPGKKPYANLDLATTYANFNSSLAGEPVTIYTLSNDFCLYGSGCTLDPSSVEVIGQPSYGAVIIDIDGNVIYTPEPGFIGDDTLRYKVCVAGEFTNCAEANQIIHVLSSGFFISNATYANDDFYFTNQSSPIVGNVLINDYDFEGDLQEVTSVGSISLPVSIFGGSYYLNASGDFTFTPDNGFSGSTSFVYEVCDVNAQSVCAKATVYIFVLRDLPLRIKVYLEGALMENGNAKDNNDRPLMRDNLRLSPFTGQNFIPVQDPYTVSTEYVDVKNKYVKVGAGSLSRFHTIPNPTAVFAVTGSNAIVDWVFIELRSKLDSSEVIATRSGLLQRDGDVVDLDGISPLAFAGVAADSFYVVARHRNHLGAMTLVTSVNEVIDMTDISTPIFDFGTTLQNGYDYTGFGTNNNVKQGYRALWGGDFDGNGRLKFVNPNDDQNILFFEVFASPGNTMTASNYNFTYGYYQGDFDLNAKSKYDNPNDDKNMLFSQILLFPLNTGLLSNFNFFIQQVPERK